VVHLQDDVNLVDRFGRPVCPVRGKPLPEFTVEPPDGAPADNHPAEPEGCQGAEDSEDSGNKAVNYRTEPMWFRAGYDPGADFGLTNDVDYANVLSNGKTGGDPAVPVFKAKAGEEVRIRVVQSGGHPRNHVIAVHGHGWEREPYAAGAVPSQHIADNPLSQVYGAQAGMGPANHFDLVLRNGAGGAFKVPGDYLIRDMASFQFDAGIWALLRVTPAQ
jgi:hypothetical protein